MSKLQEICSAGSWGQPDPEETVKCPVRMSHSSSACRAVCQPVRSAESREGLFLFCHGIFQSVLRGHSGTAAKATPAGRGPGSLPPKFWLR